MNLDADIFIQQQLDAIRIPKSTAYVVRLHDILPITHPQYFDEISIRAFAKSLHSTFKQNPYVIMDSKSSAIELKTIYGENFSVYNIPPLVDFSYFTEKQVSKKKQIIVLNTLEPRKQTLTAIEGFLNAKYNNMIFKDWKLIVAGSNGWLEESLYENLRQKTFGSDVIFFDTPSDATVCNLFNESSIVMSMSAAEGFGLPPLEGAYFGCLPVVSDIPSHREHLSEIAIFVQDTNPLEISKKLAEAVEKVSLEGDNLQIKLRSHVRDNYGKEKVTNMWKFVLDDIINLHSQSKI
jgi:glycosyltransferase involved in cell wall biosynthesis